MPALPTVGREHGNGVRPTPPPSKTEHWRTRLKCRCTDTRRVIRTVLSIAVVLAFGSILRWIGPVVEHRADVATGAATMPGVCGQRGRLKACRVPCPAVGPVRCLDERRSVGTELDQRFRHRLPSRQTKAGWDPPAGRHAGHRPVQGRVPDSQTSVLTLWPTVIILGTLSRDPHEGTARQYGQPLIYVGLHPGDVVMAGLARSARSHPLSNPGAPSRANCDDRLLAQ